MPTQNANKEVSVHWYYILSSNQRQDIVLLLLDKILKVGEGSKAQLSNSEECKLFTCLPLKSIQFMLLSHFSRVRLCATPEMAAHQAPPSLGFSRQEHQSGLPCPSPMHETEKWKGSRSVVSDSQPPHGLQPIRLLRPWDFPGKSTGVGCHCLLHTVYKYF